VVCTAQQLLKVSNEIPASTAATLMVNPFSAFLLLNSFVRLEPGDTLIQNGANSSVGELIIQLAKANGINTINVIRDREHDTLELERERLAALGAGLVVTDTELSKKGSSILQGLELPKLGINCIGGKSGADMAACLADHATMVVYGGMSRRPLMIGTSSLVFHNLTVRGFWLSTWLQQQQQPLSKPHSNDPFSVPNVLETLTSLYAQGALKTRATLFALSDLSGALQHTQDKAIIDFSLST